LFEAPKETGNKLLNKINWKIREIKMRLKIVFYSIPDWHTPTVVVCQSPTTST